MIFFNFLISFFASRSLFTVPLSSPGLQTLHCCYLQGHLTPISISPPFPVVLSSDEEETSEDPNYHSKLVQKVASMDDTVIYRSSSKVAVSQQKAASDAEEAQVGATLVFDTSSVHFMETSMSFTHSHVLISF